MADDFSDMFKVRLEPHSEIVKKRTPLGVLDEKIDFDQFKVWIEGPAVKSTNRTLHVGYIGKQFDANFCPLPAFYLCIKSHQDWIVAQVKLQHGNASSEAVVDVPPPNSHKPV